jgi:phosphoglycerate dehydrogenase-like enzyme
MTHPVWFEREVLVDLRPDIERHATILGPATPVDRHQGIEHAAGAVVGVSRFDAVVMDRAPGLKVISRTGIGVDNVDIAAATRRGIAVCNTPDGPTISTAEHAITLLLASSKCVLHANSRLRAGEQDLYARHQGMELDGSVLALIGYGRIGRRVARAGSGLGMRVIVFDPYLDEPPEAVTRAETLAALLADADAVSLHVPLTAENAGFFDKHRFGQMKPGSVFVNTARGGLVDHDALLGALESGHLLGAGLDVTDPEPLPPGHPLLERDDVIVTPHVASATKATKRRMLEMAFDQVVDVLEGRRPPHLVDPSVWPAGR